MIRIKFVKRWYCAVALMLISFSSKAQFIAAFSMNDSVVCIGNTVSFTDLSSGYSGSIISWDWDFGDGGISAAQNPSHTFVSGGIKIVSLTVTDAINQVRTVSHNVYVIEAVASPNVIHICSPANSTTLYAALPIVSGVTANWFTPSSATIVSPLNDTTVVNNLVSGTYIFFWVQTDGTCSDADQVTVIVDNPVVPNAGPDQAVCLSTPTATLAASSPSPGTGLWTTTSAATITSPTSATSTVTGLNVAGTYTFIWSVTNFACVFRDTMQIVVSASTTPNAGIDQTVCANPGTATLNATAPSPGIGLWTTTSSATITNPTSVNATVSGLTTAGTYNFIWTVTNGTCVNRDTMRITVSTLINASAGSDLQVCITTPTATLNGSNPSPGTGLWTTTSSATIVSPMNSTTVVNGLSSAGFYFFVWSVTNGACISRDTMVIIVRAPSVSNAGPDQSFCGVTSATLAGNVPSAGAGVWTTTGSATITTTSSPTSGITNLAIGNNTFIWTITLGACISRDTVIIHIDQLVISNAGPDQQLCNLNAATLAGNNAAPGNGTWTALSGGTITTPASPTSTVTGLVAGVYNFVWTIVNGTCTSRDTIRITVSTLITAAAGSDQQVCSSTGTATLAGNTPSPGSGLWTTASSATITTPSSPTSTVTGLTTAGTYSFIWTITNGACVSRDTVLITVNASVTSNAGPDQQLCSSSSSTTLAGNNAAPGNGTWTALSGGTITTPASPTSTVTGLVAGVYNFVWTIVNGTCTSRDTVRITVSTLITAAAGSDQQVCSSTGTATLAGNTPSPGSGLWTTASSATITTPSSPTSTVTGLTTAGTYSFIWTITNGACVSRDTVLITVNASVTSNAGPDQQLCSSSSSTTLAGNNAAPGNGTWTALSGGTITTPASPTSTVTGLVAGVYNFVWTIVNGTCTSRDTVRITVSTLITAAAGSDQQVCSSTGTATLAGNTPSPGSGLWTTASSATITTPSSPTSTVTGLTTAGTYSFIWTITNGACVSRDTILITVNASVTSNAGPDQQLCSSSSSTTLAGNNAAPGNGTWTALSGGTITTPASPTSTVTGLVAGVYNFVWTIVNGTCTSRDTVRITVSTLITAAAGSDQQVCSSTGTATLSGNTPSPGSGLWTTASSTTITTPSSPTSTVTGLTTAGTYSFIWTVTNGACVSADTIVITVDSLDIANAGPDQQICENVGTTNLSANTATIGTGTWSTTSTAIITNVNDPNSSVTGLIAGNHSFIWTISNGSCSASDTLNIIVDSTATTSNAGTDQTTCSSSVIALNGNIPTTGTGLWSSLSGASIADSSLATTTVSGFITGDNLFVWTITNGTCVSSDTIIVHANSNPLAEAGSDAFITTGLSVILGGTPTAIGGAAPYTYVWTPLTYLDDSTIANPTSTPTFTTVYTLTITDSLGCQSTDIVTVYINNPPFAIDDTITINEDSLFVIMPLLNDTDADNNINPASVTINFGPYNGMAIIDPLTGSITYTPTANYFGTDSIQYAVCDSGIPVYCDTAWIYLTILPINDAPIAVDDYANTMEDSCITINALFNDTDVENNINPASFAIVNYPIHGTVTLDTIAGQIIYCPDLAYNGIDTIMYALCDSGIPILCDTAYIIINVSPVNNAPVAINDSITICSSDSIIISILNNDSDIDGDSLFASIITMPQHGNAAIDANYQIGYAPIAGYDGTDTIAYLICDNALISLCDTGYVFITVHSNPLLSSISSSINCFGDSTGTIDLTVVGNAPFSYLWNTTDTIEDLNNLPFGFYQVTVIDSNNCAATLTDSINGPVNPLSVNSILQAVNCFGDTTGSIQLTVSGGTSPYQYNWNTGDSTAMLDSIPSGIYFVTIMDTNGCTLNYSDTVVQPSTALSASSLITNVICYGDSTGSIQLNVSGGTPNYLFNWSDGDTSMINNFLTAGIYTVTITDSNACAVILIDTLINTNTEITTSFITQSPQCLNGVTGSIQVNVNGGITPYQYLWNTNDTINSIDSLQAGNYSLIISDAIGCFSSASILLADSSTINSNISGDTSLCVGDTVQLIGAYYSNSVYQWYVDSIAIFDTDSNIYNASAAGNYFFTLANNCGVYSSSIIQLTQNALPIITVTDDFTMDCDSSATLLVSGGNSYLWSPSIGLSNDTIDNPVASPANSTLYFVLVTDVNGCTATDSLNITIECDSIEVPSGFSPNGDNLNDYLVINHISDYPGNRLEIFNRWGNLVYRKTDYDNSFNGLSNVELATLGFELTDGTYFYVLDLNNGETKNGYVILRR